MSHALFHAGIKALITDKDGQVLLFKTIAFKTDPAHWDLPGGRMEDGQSVEDTLRREIKEETGITEVNEIAFFGGYISNIRIPISDTGDVGLVLMVYTVRVPENSTIRISQEHTEYKWASRMEAAKLLGHKYPAEFTQALSLANPG